MDGGVTQVSFYKAFTVKLLKTWMVQLMAELVKSVETKEIQNEYKESCCHLQRVEAETQENSSDHSVYVVFEPD